MQVQSLWPQKATPCTKTHHTTCRSLRLVHRFLQSSPFLLNPQNPMLYNWPNTQTKSDPSHGASASPCNAYFLDLTDLASQTASRPVQPFSHSSQQRVPMLCYTWEKHFLVSLPSNAWRRNLVIYLVVKSHTLYFTICTKRQLTYD